MTYKILAVLYVLVGGLFNLVMVVGLLFTYDNEAPASAMNDAFILHLVAIGLFCMSAYRLWQREPRWWLYTLLSATVIIATSWFVLPQPI